MTTESQPRQEPPRRLSHELAGLAEVASQRTLSLGEILERLRGRVYPLLLVLIAVPFCQPIALPGLSTPFGLVIALLGLRFAFRQKPWLPARLMRVSLTPRFLPAVLRGGARILGWIEKLLHPRLAWVFEWKLIQFTTGIAICFCGLLLLLPLPVPFSNLFPALAVVLGASAISERDGLMLFVACGVFLLACGYFVLIFWGGAELVAWLNGLFSGLFGGD